MLNEDQDNPHEDMFGGSESIIDYQQKREQKRERVKLENDKRKHEEEMLIHPSFRHRLRLKEAEIIYDYTELVKNRYMPINFQEIDVYLRRF